MFYRSKSKYQSCSFIIFFLISAIILVHYPQTYASESEDEGQTTTPQAYELVERSTFEETLEVRDDETSNGQETAKYFPEVYTLMLLDRALVDYEKIACKEKNDFWPFISPRVITMDDRADYFSIVVERQSYCVCKLMRQYSENRAEALIDTMIEGGRKRAEIDVASKSDTSSSEKVFSSAMILLPLTGSQDKVLAYLFGNWPSILNVDTIVKNFGLRAATSVGIFCEAEDRENDNLATINQIGSEDCRIDDPMNMRLRSRRGLHIFNHFRLNVGDSKIEAVRFKPIFKWGRAYITASDAFQFRPGDLGDSPLETLHDKAIEIYTIFNQSTSERIYVPFQPFIDIPVSGKLAEDLTTELVKNWPNYFRRRREDVDLETDGLVIDIVYPHWTYWFRTRDALNRWAIYAFRGRQIQKDARVELKFYRSDPINIPLLKLIRTLPIVFEGKYYWFDRGDWFELSETRIQAMAAELERDKFDYRDPLLLPPYDEERIRLEKTEGAALLPEEVSIKEEEGGDEAEIEAEGEAERNVTPKVKGDYEELAYNKEVFQQLCADAKEGNVSWVALMDRANVVLTGAHDKFEFADLVLKVQDHYYLIHVKRAKANSLGHVCTQAERCGMFLSGHLDRSNLELAFMMAELNSRPETFAGTRETSPDLFNKSMLPDSLDGGYHDFLEAHVFNKNNVFCDDLKAFIKTKDFDTEFWLAHHSLFCYVLSRIATLIDEKLTTETFKEFHTIAQNGINKSAFFTEVGVLGAEKRRKITIVVAIIDDGKTPFALIPKEREFKTNSIVRLHQTRQTLSEKRLGFAWTVIPKKADVPVETLREYAYSADDIDTILRLKVLKKTSPTATPSERKPSKTASVKINIGTKKAPQTITLIQVPAKNMLIVPSFKKSKSAGTTETYLAKVLYQLVQQKSIAIPYTILMPYEIAQGHWVTVEISLKEKSIQIKVIKCSVNKKDQLNEKAETFKDTLISRSDFKKALEKIYKKSTRAKTKGKSKSLSSLGTEIDLQVEQPLGHPYTHASGAITVRNILMIADVGLSDADEEIDDADAIVYHIKYEHWQFLLDEECNFSTVFEACEDGGGTPRAKTTVPPVRQVRQAALGAHTKSETATTRARSKGISAAPPSSTIVVDLEHPQSIPKGEGLRAYAQITVNYGEAGRPDGLQDAYVACPTIGDGDCFFHAILTEAEEGKNTVTERAATIRDALSDTVLDNEDYKLAVKKELLDKYKSKERAKPAHIKRIFDANDAYYQLRRLGDIFPLDSPLKTAQGDLTADPVPPYADEDLLLAITDDDIRTYLADYCSSNVSLSKAYIPVRFDEHHNAYNCLGDVIANHLNMKVYIFRYSSSTRHMDYLGTIGNPDSTNIRYVLQHGDHYWALYHNSFSEAEKARLRQIECNQTGKVLVRDSRTVAAVTHNDDAIPSQASSVSQGGALADPSHFAKRDIRRFLKPKTRASVS